MPRGRKRRSNLWVSDVEPHGRKFRFKVYGGDKPENQTFDTRKEADKQREEWIKQLRLSEIPSVEEAIEEYEVWKGDPNGGANKPRSVETVVDRLNSFFPDSIRKIRLDALTEIKCRTLYEDLKQSVAVDTHKGTLKVVKTFLTWCVTEKKWIKVNSAQNIKAPLGGSKKGVESKPQLRLDEARRFTDVALWLCTYGADVLNFEGGRRPQHGIGGPAAALATFFLGLRTDEVASRQVRDLDDNGRILWVEGNANAGVKSNAGRRKVKIPEFLQGIFRELTFKPMPAVKHLRSKKRLQDALTNRPRKAPTDRLFGGTRHWVLDWVKRICELAGAPIVCAHAMRGLHATLAVEEGETGNAVTRALGHEYRSFKRVTLAHYAQPGSFEAATQARVLERVFRTKVPDQRSTPEISPRTEIKPARPSEISTPATLSRPGISPSAPTAEGEISSAAPSPKTEAKKPEICPTDGGEGCP